MSIGRAIDLFIEFTTQDPGLLIIGGFTIIGFLAIIVVLSLFLWGSVKRVWCWIKGHRYYALEECFRCGKTHEL